MFIRPLLAFVTILAAGVVPADSASANSGYGTPAKFVVDDEPIDVFYVVHRPKSFPNALFLVEFRSVDYGEWKRSIGKASFDRSRSGMKTLKVSWTTGPLKGEAAVLDILTPTVGQWNDRESGKQTPSGQQFEIKTVVLPEAVSNQLASMRTVSLHHAVLKSK